MMNGQSLLSKSSFSASDAPATVSVEEVGGRGICRQHQNWLDISSTLSNSAGTPVGWCSVPMRLGHSQQASYVVKCMMRMDMRRS